MCGGGMPDAERGADGAGERLGIVGPHGVPSNPSDNEV